MVAHRTCSPQDRNASGCGTNTGHSHIYCLHSVEDVYRQQLGSEGVAVWKSFQNCGNINCLQAPDDIKFAIYIYICGIWYYHDNDLSCKKDYFIRYCILTKKNLDVLPYYIYMFKVNKKVKQIKLQNDDHVQYITLNTL